MTQLLKRRTLGRTITIFHAAHQLVLCASPSHHMEVIHVGGLLCSILPSCQAACNPCIVSRALRWTSNARRIVISPFNTKPSSIFFAFTPFAAGNGSTSAGRDGGVNYFWGLGTVKGTDNVLTLNVSSFQTSRLKHQEFDDSNNFGLGTMKGTDNALLLNVSGLQAIQFSCKFGDWWHPQPAACLLHTASVPCCLATR